MAMNLPPQNRPGSADQILDWINTDPAQLLSNCCIFLDVDGTLIEFREDPVSATADSELIALLQDTAAMFGGALALVSGRLLATLDTMLAPLRLPASGLYGLERRDADGAVHRRLNSVQALDSARGMITDFAVAHPGLIVEDKGTAIALHYRRAPAYGADCRRTAYAAVAGLWPLYLVIEGSMVVDIVPTGASKATAIEEFLLEPPFARRIPIALGDDFSDCDAFSAVHRHGGVAVAVGRRIYGDYRLDDCRAARQWLASLAGLKSR
jgi:trehalose 6-phosphate phosphatase